jgi:hypothetical protein
MLVFWNERPECIYQFVNYLIGCGVKECLVLVGIKDKSLDQILRLVTANALHCSFLHHILLGL